MNSYKAMIAIALSLIMAFSIVPVSVSGSEVGTTAHSASLVQNEDGTYVLRSDYFEDAFGLQPNPSDIEDPLDGTIVVEPMEIVSFRGGSNMEFVVMEPDGTHVSDSSTMLHTTSDSKGESFAAALTRESNHVHIYRDWVCTLFQQGNHLMFCADNDEPGYEYVEYVVDLGIVDYPREQEQLAAMGAGNLFSYAVGDYDGDGNEEVAVFDGTTISFIGFEDGGYGLVMYYSERLLPVPNNPYYCTPSSMCTADVDGDGIDDVVLTLETWSVENYFETYLFSVVPSKEQADSLRVQIPEVDGSYIDTAMVSIDAADVDGDGFQEIVVGGYGWNNQNTSLSHTRDWAYHAGELFLAYCELENLPNGNPQDFRVDLDAVTILGDDNDTASNLFFGSSHWDPQGDHNVQDTSIYMEIEDPPRLARSPSWYNWTIPLQGVDLEGFTDGYEEQVFFNTWFYQLEGNSFTVHSKTERWTGTADSNRMMCTFIEGANIWEQTPEDWDGKESLFIGYLVDLESHFSGGDTEMGFVIFDHSGEEYASKTESDSYLDGRATSTFEWEYRFTGNPMVMNDDTDDYVAEYLAHMYTYTDPNVIAVVSGVPYDQDLADVLISGPDSIGSTEFEKSSETGSGTESSFEISAGGQGGLEALWMEISGEAGYAHEFSDSRTQTIAFSTSYESAEDSVALYVIPMDVYLYKVTEPDGDGGMRSTVQSITLYGDAVNVMMEYEEYVEFILNYNRMMTSFSSDYNSLPIADIGVHELGDISTYIDTPVDPLANVSVMYRGDGIHNTVTQSVELSEESEHVEGNGGSFNLDVQCHILCGMAGYTFEVGGMDSTISVDASGMGFTSSLNQGMEIDYLGDPSEAGEVLGQYIMNGDFWAEMRSSTDENGNVLDYVYVGYTVDSYSSAPEPGSLSPDVYVPDGTDEDDPYNPTSDSVSLRAFIPDIGERPERTADKYTLQISWQGHWYDVNSTMLDITAERETSEGWIVSDSVEPGMQGSYVWFKVSGLEGLGYSSYEFRLMASSVDGVQERINPTLPVTAYLDMRHIADEIRIVQGSSLGDGRVSVDESHLRGVGVVALMIDVSDIPGEHVDVLVSNDTLHMLAENLQVTSEGYVVVVCEMLDSGGIDTPTDSEEKPSVTVVAAMVVLGMVVVGLVMRQEE